MSQPSSRASSRSRASSISSTGAVDDEVERWPWDQPLFPRFNQLVEIGRTWIREHPGVDLDAFHESAQEILAYNAVSMSTFSDITTPLLTNDYDFCMMYRQDFGNFISDTWGLFINGERFDTPDIPDDTVYDEKVSGLMSESLILKMFEETPLMPSPRSDNFVDTILAMQQMNMTELLNKLSKYAIQSFLDTRGIKMESLSGVEKKAEEKLISLLQYVRLAPNHTRFDLTCNSNMLSLTTTCLTYFTVVSSRMGISGPPEISCFATIPLSSVLDLTPTNLLRPNALKLSGYEEIVKNLRLCYTTIERYFSDNTVIQSDGREINFDGFNEKLCQEIQRPAREAAAAAAAARTERLQLSLFGKPG